MVYASKYKKMNAGEWGRAFENKDTVSLETLIAFNKEVVDRGSNVTGEVFKKSGTILEHMDLNLTRNDIRRLEAGYASPAEKFTRKHLEVMGQLLKQIKDQGWEITDFRTHSNGQRLTATIESGGQTVIVTLLDPSISRIGNINRGGVSFYAHKKMEDDKMIKKSVNDLVKNSMAILESFLSPDYKAPTKVGYNNSKGYLRLTYKGVDYSVTNNYRENAGLDIIDPLAPKNFLEVVRQAYERAREDEDFEKELPDVDRLVVNGQLDLRLVDMKVVNQYSERQLVLDLLSQEFSERVRKGASLDDIRRELMTDLSGLAMRDDVNLNQYENSGISELEDDLNRDLSDVDESTIEEDGDDLEVSNVEVGSRSALATRLVGLMNEHGEPLAGWISQEQFESSPLYQSTIEQVIMSAAQCGVTITDASFDRDGVLHWRGTQDVDSPNNDANPFKRELSGRLGQFFFPAEQDYYDETLGKTIKKGVMHLKYGSGKEQFAVPYWQMHFTQPIERSVFTNSKFPEGDPRRINSYRGDLQGRMVFKGYQQLLNQGISTAIKHQILVANGDSSVYDASTLNRIYRQASEIKVEALERPGVVEQARASVVIPDRYLSQIGQLREREAFRDGRGATEDQYIRYVLNGTEGILCPIATTEGPKYGLRRCLTTQALALFEKHMLEDPTGKFAVSGQIDYAHYNGAGEASFLEEGLLSVPDSLKEEIREFYRSLPNGEVLELPADDADPKEWLKLCRSPLVEAYYHEYGLHDASDRQNMTLKAMQVGLDVIGGHFDTQEREKPNVAYTTLGGMTYEDGLVLSKEFVERYQAETGTRIRIGDKFTDQHGNKGVVNYISGVDPSDPLYHKDCELFFKEANGSVDFVQAPFSPTGRANAGTLREANDGFHDTIYYPEDDPRAFDENGERRVWATVSSVAMVRTPYTALKKTVPYELKDGPKKRKLSMQHKAVLEARDCQGLMKAYYKNNESKEVEFVNYLNALGYQFADDSDGVLLPGHVGFTQKVQESYTTLYDASDNPITRKVERIFEEPNSNMLVMDVEDVFQRNEMLASYALPSEGGYLRLPISYSLLADGTNATSPNAAGSFESQYIYVLPEKYRDQEELIDGTLNVHSYTKSLEKIVQTAELNQMAKMEYIRGHFEAFGVPPVRMGDYKSYEEVEQALENKDPNFMRTLATYPFNPIKVDLNALPEAKRAEVMERMPMINAFNAQYPEKVSELNNELSSSIGNYQKAIARDKMGVDARGAKHSFLRRNIIGRNLDNSVSSILTANTNIEPDTLALGPLTAYGLGIIQPKPEIRAEVEALCAVEDFEKVQDLLANDGWEYAKGVEPNMRIAAWRDPVLHTPSIAGFKFEINNQLVGVAINPIVTKGFAADFDGDQFGLQFPKDKESQKDLEAKISIESHMMNFRTEPLLNLGMDNAHYFAQSDEAKCIQEAHDRRMAREGKPAEQLNMKQLVSAYVNEIRDRALGNELSMRNLMEKRYEARNGKAFDRDRYYHLIEHPNQIKTDEDRVLLKAGSQIDDYARLKSREMMMREVKDFSSKYVSNNDGQYSDFTLNMSSKEKIFESIKEMVDQGLKGNMGGYARCEKFYDNGARFEDAQQQAKAQAGKVDFTGVAGSGFLRSYLLSVDNASLVDVDVLHRDFAVENGVIKPYGEWKEGKLRMRVSDIEIVSGAMEAPTQAVMQLKHDPRDVEPMRQFLQNARKFVVGNEHKRPVKIDLDFETFDKKMGGSFAGMVEPNDSPARKQAAAYLDKHLTIAKSNGATDMQIDINYGGAYMTGDKEPMSDQKLSLEVRKEIYGLMYEATWGGRGLDYSRADWETLQKHVRDDKGLMIPFEENRLHNGTMIDQIAQNGFESVVEIANHNYKNVYNVKDDQGKTRVVAPCKMSDGYYNQYVVGSMDKIVEKVKETISNARDVFEQEIKLRQEALEQALAEAKKDKEAALERVSVDFAFNDAELDKALEVDISNEREVSINREFNGEPFAGGDFVDSKKGLGHDGPQMDAANSKLSDLNPEYVPEKTKTTQVVVETPDYDANLESLMASEPVVEITTAQLFGEDEAFNELIAEAKKNDEKVTQPVTQSPVVDKQPETVEVNYAGVEVPKQQETREVNYAGVEVPKQQETREVNYAGVEVPKPAETHEVNYAGVEVPKQQEPIRSNDVEKAVEVAETSVEEAPKKRGPGRPRKVVETPDVSFETLVEEAPKKRGPGRPRKVVEVPENSTTQKTEVSEKPTKSKKSKDLGFDF